MTLKITTYQINNTRNTPLFPARGVFGIIARGGFGIIVDATSGGAHPSIYSLTH